MTYKKSIKIIMYLILGCITSNIVSMDLVRQCLKKKKKTIHTLNPTDSLEIGPNVILRKSESQDDLFDLINTDKKTTQKALFKKKHKQHAKFDKKLIAQVTFLIAILYILNYTIPGYICYYT